MSFGERLAKLRKEKGMSQEDLANNLNISRQAVSKWESNSSYPETEKIVAICKLFDCSMDELIGLKEGKGKSKNKTLNIINEYFDKFIKGVKMFYAMTFKQKIKCLFEMGFYFLILFILFLITDTLIVVIVRKLLYLLPNELLFILIQIVEGLFYIVYIVFMIYALVKLYKVRYLDYYENYLKEQNINVEVINEEKEETIKKIKIKEEKIIIRDSQNEFRPFSWIKKSFLIFCKIIVLFCCIGLGIAFVLLVTVIIFAIYFINNSKLILYIALGLIGALLGIYILIEIFIKFIFNMKQSPKKLFVMFIVAMLTVGISCGFFASEVTSYKIMTAPIYNKIIHTEKVKMQEELIINFLNYYDTEIVFETREDILIEFYGTDINISPINVYTENIECLSNSYSNSKKFQLYEYYSTNYFNGYSVNDIIQNALIAIKDKKIYVEEYYFYSFPKIRISKENYEKLLKNKNELNNYMNSEYTYCEYN